MANVTLNFQVTQNGKKCKDPIIFLFAESGELAFPCGDKVDKNGNVKLSIPDDIFGSSCVKGIIKCAECDNCKEKEFEVCLCNGKDDCKACQDCVNGVCVDLCPKGKKCVNGECSECEENTDCPKGFVCINGKCVCAGKVNSFGECVECLGKADCPICSECINGVCTPTVCPNNLVCLNGECGCPPGSKYNVITQSCESFECSTDAQCADCETCVAGQCTPVVCPDGYKCVGDECVPWPCKDTKCENGADCGDGCGCLNGECVPCALLDCGSEAASCQGALGCKCNGSKCEPVNNCGQYCDSWTPCLDTNCTCYNNECVSCENFSCENEEGGCASRTNCQCVNGDCEGGGDGGCNDSLKLTKTSECSANGCELKATFTSQKGCGCDPIDFRVKNVPLTNDSNNIMNIAVAMYKNNIAYANYLSEITIGDDELVSATLKTTIVHKVDGNTVNPSVSNVGDVIVDGSNKISNIKINSNNISKSFGQKGTRVLVEVRAVNVKIVNNGCIGYGEKLVAQFELDYTSASSTQITDNRLKGEYADETSVKINDTSSKRRPLFVWSKSNGSSFSNSKFNNSTGQYAQSGWFRKEYGESVNNQWVDKINNPLEQLAEGETKELWNNYNYKVAVDCGCKQNFDTMQNVVFCCTDKVQPVLTNCNRTVNIDKFNVCSVNEYLGAQTGAYKIPKESQTFFWLVINGGEYEKKLRTEGGNLVNAMTPYTHTKPITSLKIQQRYEGSPTTAIACEKEFTYEDVSPDYDLTKECGKVVVKNRTGNPIISSVVLKDGTSSYPFVSSLGGNTWTLENNVIKKDGTFTLEVAFAGGCTRVDEIIIECEPEITGDPEPSIYALAECGGTNPNILATTVKGYTNKVKFSIDGTNFFDVSNPSATDLKFKYLFTNGNKGYAAGTYTITAKEDGKKTVTTTVVVKEPKKAILEKTQICGTTNGLIKITNAVAGSKWKVFGPAYNGTSFSADTSGKFEVSIPFSKPGSYSVVFDSDALSATEKTCPQTLIAEIKDDGGTVTPTIIMSGNITQACSGERLKFMIYDGGKNLLYNVIGENGAFTIGSDSENGAGISTLRASTQDTPIWGWVKFNTGVTSPRIKITGLNATGCYIMSPSVVQKDLTVVPGPSITSVTVECTAQQNYYIVSVVANLQGLTVTAQGTPLNYVGPTNGGKFQYTSSSPHVYNVTGTIPVEASVAGSTCVATSTGTVNCTPGGNCPPPSSVVIEVNANPTSPTCSNGENVGLLFQYATGLGNLNGKQYAWYKEQNGSYVLATTQFANPGTIDTSQSNWIPPLNTVSTTTVDRYKLGISDGNCSYESDAIEVYSSDTPISSTIFGAGLQGDTTEITTNGTFNYYVTLVPNATYTWTLSNSNGQNQPVGSNTNSIDISNFVSGTNYINVTITTPSGCSESGTATLNVGSSCGSAAASISLLDPTKENCTNLVGVINNVPSGYSVSLYEWRVSTDDGNTYTALQTGTTSPVSNFNTSILTAGADVKVKLYVELSGAGSCNFESSPFDYSRCEGGCDCVYNITATELSGNTAQIPSTIGSTYAFQNWIVAPATNNGFNVYVNTSSSVSKQCAGQATPSNISFTPASPEPKQFEIKSFKYSVTEITSASQVTSIDLINNGVAQTVTVPSGSGDNPVNLRAFLETVISGQCIFNIVGSSTLQMFVQSTNTGGFNPNGSYLKGGSTTQFSSKLSFTSTLLACIYITPCGEINIVRSFNLNQIVGYDGSSTHHVKVDYNSVYKDTGITPVAMTLQNVGTAAPNTRTCTGCNTVA